MSMFGGLFGGNGGSASSGANGAPAKAVMPNGQVNNGAQGPAAGNQGNPSNNQGNNPQGNQPDPNAGSNQTVNPLDIYNKMFDNTNTQVDAAPEFNLDPGNMDKIVGGMDFMNGIDPDLMQRAMSGDSKAFMEVIQNSNRNVYRSAIEHGGVLNSKFVSAREAHNNKGLSGKVKQELTTNALSKTPNFQHPVVRQQLTEIAQRLHRANPDASPEDIAESAKKYLTDLAGALNPDTGKETAAKGNAEPDWDKFFGDEPKSS
jgi:hypothetical protein